MKAVFALLSALLFAWAQATTLGQPAPASAASCHCARACCSASQSSEAPAAPAVPAAVTFQPQLLSLTATSVVWVMPAAGGSTVAISVVLPLTTASAPLYTRDCARLI